MNEPIHPTEPPDAGYVAPRAQVAVAGAPALSRQALFARIGLLGIAVAALLAAVIVVLSSSAAPNGILAAGSGNATNGAANGPVDLMNGGPGFKGGRGFGPGFGEITITAINGNNISLKTEDGWTRTISVDSGTTYTKAGASIALGDLKVGDEVGFKQTLESNGTWSIDAIVVLLPTSGGEVTKIDGSTITVTTRNGATAIIKVTGQTKYSVNGKGSAALSDVKVGMFLVAEGTKNSDGSLTASNVKSASISTFEGRGNPGRGFHFGPGSSAAPSASGAAS